VFNWRESIPVSKTIMGAGLALGVFALTMGACQDFPWPDGHACVSDAQCEHALCLHGTCQDPHEDADNDGLSNAREMELGTNPLYFDSDNDQLADGVEVGEGHEPLDSDGDGKIDALESAFADADLDCIRDPYDPNDDVAETNLALVRDANCRREGVCGQYVEHIDVACNIVEQDGGKVALAVCDYQNVPQYQSDPETRCDGLDNDCDGENDEALAYIQGDGAVRTLGDACKGFGACSALEGSVECGRDFLLTCSVNEQGSSPSGAKETLCDNIDNDCNGIIDDGVSWIDPNTGAKRTVGETCEGRGLCGLGIVECSANGKDGICSSEKGGSNDESLTEVCDSYDNDCDGEIDEGQFYEQNESVLALGETCGLGACTGGEVLCKDGVATCSTLEGASDGGELCNGIDDDCDGEIDEIEGLAVHCSTKGVCLQLNVVQVNCEGDGLIPICDYEEAIDLELGSEESCDGLDNDCDGEIDENLHYTSATGETYALGEACPGLGACSAFDSGVVECTNTGAVQCSTNLVHAVEESCNGIDDDCDGEIDELEPTDQPENLCATVGVCAALADVPAACDNGEWQCPYTKLDTYELQEQSCDGLDNDCDGIVDEGTIKKLTGKVSQVLDGQPPERQRWLVLPEEQGAGLLFGGWYLTKNSTVQLLDDFWRYETSTGGWTKLPEGPPERAQHAASFDHEHNVFIIHGGLHLPEKGMPGAVPNGSARSDMWLYEVDTMTWSQVSQDWSMVPGDNPIERRTHTLTAVGNGVFVVHGGLTNGSLMPDRVTLKATLKPIGADGGWLCFWEPLGTGTGSRLAHNSLYDAVNDRVVIVGGVAPNGTKLSFLEFLDLSDGNWSAVDSFDLTPPNRLYPASTMQGNVVVIHGGEAPVGAGPNKSSTPMNDTFLVDLATDSVVKVGGNKPPNAMQGAALIPSWAGIVELVGGIEDDQFSARRSWQLSLSNLAWTEPLTWKGPVPRVGAVLVGDPGMSDLWLVGGHRKTQGKTKAIFDAWKYELGGTGWTSFTNALTADNLPVENASFPAAASGVYDATGSRILIFGEDLEPGHIWSFDTQSKTFNILTTKGSLPPTMQSTTAILGPNKKTIFWTGLFLGKGYVYRLELDSLKWTPVVASGNAPTKSQAMVAGLHKDTLMTVTIQGDASLSFQNLDLQQHAWIDFGDVTPPGGVEGLVTAGFDSPGQQALMILKHPEDQIKMWVADFKIPAIFPLEAWWPLEKAGSTIVFNPVLGAVTVGGKHPSGRTTSTTYGFEQICSD
jgi:hypothetical protein